MHSRKEPEAEILKLAAKQAGVISQGQLEWSGCPAGAGRRWKRDWVRLQRGIYCLREPSWLSWCWAAMLHAGLTSVVGSSAAAHLLGVVVEPPSRILVWHDRASALEPIGDSAAGVVFRRAKRSGRGEPRRTPIDVTLLDIAAEATEDESVAIITRAFSRGFTKPSRLLAECHRRKKVSRRSVVVALCEEASRGVESVLEWRFLNSVIRRHWLPEPKRQAHLAMARDNRLAISGLQTLRYGWHDVTQRPCEVAQQLSEVLVARGWTGAGKMCAACRIV